MTRRITAMAAAACLCTCGLAAAQSADDVRALIESRVGDASSLMMPATDDGLPQPDDERYRITPEKKRLGKLLFFDPIRSNAMRPEYGGLHALAQSTSCGTCHIGLAATKAGQQVAIATGGEGFGHIDAVSGLFVGTRTMIPGLTDVLPTAVEKVDGVGNVTMSGRFDAVDSPGRTAPSVIGFAFNNRMFGGGASGEPYDPTNPNKANLNFHDLPAGENTVETTFKAHRMFEAQQYALQQNPVYVELFRRAFPDEAVVADMTDNLDALINDDTIGRAMAAFLRTVVTRNTPWDKFLAGDDAALTAQELRGAWLFFAERDSGGANCVACHSGPALNKTVGDEAGALVDENFHNVGIGDHPMMALMRSAMNDETIRDHGRKDVTADAEMNFKFRTPTLRQVRDGAPFMHNGSLNTLKSVIEYFNAGDPQDPDAVAAGNVSPLFQHDDGEQGLGMSADDVDALTAFVGEGLYDAALVTHDPRSTTETFELNRDDMNYDLVLQLLGAQNNQLPSGLEHPQTDARAAEEIAAVNRLTQNNVCASFDMVSAFGLAVPLGILSRRGIRRRRRKA